MTADCRVCFKGHVPHMHSVSVSTGGHCKIKSDQTDQIRSNQIKLNVGNFPGRRKGAALSVTLYRCLCKACSNLVAILVFQQMGSWFPCSASGVSINSRYVDVRLHTLSEETMYATQQILVAPRIADVKNICNLQVLGRPGVKSFFCGSRGRCVKCEKLPQVMSLESACFCG